ncbi:MAG: methyltransferase domain-containing protein [Proteobacteria bacterium]|nr:methyltransferase domain-containing protein [Pseudomonadota bacterium]
MQIDASDLSDYYETPAGQVARRHIFRRVRQAWPDLTGQRVLGYGFAIPYLRPFLGEAERVIALLPSHQGQTSWPEGKSLTLQSEEHALPFPDAMFDSILVVHGLEAAEATRTLMRQLWRVLAPAGRLLIVAPNRTSLWAQIDRTPFAYGRPFNRMQLDKLLQDSLFVAERWDNALHFPPLRSKRFVRSGAGWEGVGRRLWPGLAGVHIVEASKSMYATTAPLRVKDAKPALARAGG